MGSHLLPIAMRYSASERAAVGDVSPAFRWSRKRGIAISILFVAIIERVVGLRKVLR